MNTIIIAIFVHLNVLCMKFFNMLLFMDDADIIYQLFFEKLNFL